MDAESGVGEVYVVQGAVLVCVLSLMLRDTCVLIGVVDGTRIGASQFFVNLLSQANPWIPLHRPYLLM